MYLVEVQSQPSAEDQFRMFLQGASIVRFANKHHPSFKVEKNYYVVAVYIWWNGKADRFILYQENGDDTVRGPELQKGRSTDIL